MKKIVHAIFHIFTHVFNWVTKMLNFFYQYIYLFFCFFQEERAEMLLRVPLDSGLSMPNPTFLHWLWCV